MHLAEGCAICSLIGGRPGADQRLGRKLGMGSPASPLSWDLSCDAIIAGVQVASGAPVPTYVDDSAALVESIENGLPVLVFFLAASATARLLVKCSMPP